MSDIIRTSKVLGGYIGGFAAPPAVPYVGPGDSAVVPGALGWWGTRAYTAALIGTKAIRLRASGDNTESDFNTVSGGGLDLGGINTFLTAHGGSLFVTKMYDQAGSNDFVQATAANQPQFILNVINGLPAIRGNGGGSGTQQWALETASTITQAQPLTFSIVFNQETSGIAEYVINVGSGAVQFLINADLAGNLEVFANASVFKPASDGVGVWHTGAGVFNSTSSICTVDGSDSTGDAGTGALTGQTLESFGGSIGNNRFITGYQTELGFWTSAFSGTQRTNMNSNQHTYYGF